MCGLFGGYIDAYRQKCWIFRRYVAEIIYEPHHLSAHAEETHEVGVIDELLSTACNTTNMSENMNI